MKAPGSFASWPSPGLQDSAICLSSGHFFSFHQYFEHLTCTFGKSARKNGDALSFLCSDLEWIVIAVVPQIGGDKIGSIRGPYNAMGFPSKVEKIPVSLSQLADARVGLSRQNVSFQHLRPRGHQGGGGPVKTPLSSQIFSQENRLLSISSCLCQAGGIFCKKKIQNKSDASAASHFSTSWSRTSRDFFCPQLQGESLQVLHVADEEGALTAAESRSRMFLFVFCVYLAKQIAAMNPLGGIWLTLSVNSLHLVDLMNVKRCENFSTTFWSGSLFLGRLLQSFWKPGKKIEIFLILQSRLGKKQGWIAQAICVSARMSKRYLPNCAQQNEVLRTCSAVCMSQFVCIVHVSAAVCFCPPLVIRCEAPGMCKCPYKSRLAKFCANCIFPCEVRVTRCICCSLRDC